jgi:hypothetical protein
VRQPRSPNHIPDRLGLEMLSLVDEFEFQVTGADRDGLRLALGDDAGPDTPQARERDAKPVMRMEALDLNPGAIQLGNDGDVAVGQYTIYVEEQNFDIARTRLGILKSHVAMIQVREEVIALRRSRIWIGILAALLALGALIATRQASARVAFMGDSLTQGWSFPRANFGIYGQTTGEMLERFPRQIDSGGFREVIILGGTNDTLLGVDRNVTLKHLGRMVDEAHAHGVSPVLAQIPPIYRGDGIYLPAVRTLDDGIVALGREKGVPVIDYFSALEGQRTAYSDGIHLKRRGYLRMEWALLKVAHPF